MKISAEAAIIPREKLTGYLLVYQPESDKSQFLAQAGFHSDNPDALETAIREMLKTHDAVLDKQTPFGDMYRVEGTLKGIHTHDLLVVTVWIMRTEEEGLYRFVTLKPWRNKNNAT